MTNLLLKTKTELFKWHSERERERERERARARAREDTRAQTQAGNSEKLQGSIFLPLFQFKVHRTNCEQHSRLLPEHVNMFISYMFIYEIGYCYEDRR